MTHLTLDGSAKSYCAGCAASSGGRCRSCAATAKHAERRAIMESGKGRACTKCELWRPWSSFRAASTKSNGGGASGRSPRCFWCISTDEGRAIACTRTSRDCLAVSGLGFCERCREVRSLAYFGKGEGTRICSFCSRSRSLRREGVEANGPVLAERWEAQGGRCASCAKAMRLRRTDCVPARYATAHHCHDSLKFKDWLCSHCNAAEGHLRGDPHLARMLADYMERNGATPKDGPDPLAMT